MKNFLQHFFGPKPDPNRPLAEYPSDGFRSIQAALRFGLTQYRERNDSRPLDISWQGQGGRLDSYLIKDLRLSGAILSFDGLPIQWEDVCREMGIDYASLRGGQESDLDIQSLSTEVLASLIESVFVKHLAMKPWDDSNDYCLGMEYSEITETGEVEG